MAGENAQDARCQLDNSGIFDNGAGAGRQRRGKGLPGSYLLRCSLPVALFVGKAQLYATGRDRPAAGLAEAVRIAPVRPGQHGIVVHCGPLSGMTKSAAQLTS